MRFCFVSNFITKNAKIKRKKFEKINVNFLNHNNDVNFIDMIESFVLHLQRIEINRQTNYEFVELQYVKILLLYNMNIVVVNKKVFSNNEKRTTDLL